MNGITGLTVRNALACAVVAVMGHAGVASAADPPDFTIDFPAGIACDFELRVEGRDGNIHTKEFFDKNGNLVRIISAGKGAAITYTNLDAGAQYNSRSNGAVTRTTFDADGSARIAITGHNLLILFPTDVPAGPSTTIYIGRAVFTVDLNGVFVLQETSGRSIDICAALS